MAEDYDGFPPILSNMLTQVLGWNTTPVYLVFQSEPVPHLCRYEAKVLLRRSPAKDGKPLIFKGKPMPTSVLAVQTAAAEAIFRLRFNLSKVAEMQEFRYFPSSSSAGCEFASAVGIADPTVAHLVQFIAAQGSLLAGILREFQAVDRDANRVVMEAYREARQVASQTTVPLLSNPVPPSQIVPPSQPVNPCQPGIIHPSYVARAIRRLRRRGVFRQAPAATQAVAPQLIVVSDDEDGSWLSLRPPGEPQQE